MADNNNGNGVPAAARVDGEGGRGNEVNQAPVGEELLASMEEMRAETARMRMDQALVVRLAQGQ